MNENRLETMLESLIELMGRSNRKVFIRLCDAFLVTERENSARINAIRFNGFLMQMMQSEIPLNNIWRVALHDDEMVELYDFTMPSTNDKLKHTIPIIDAPEFIKNGLAVLQIVRDDTTVEGIGKRLTSRLFYIMERHDGGDTREESERCD